MMFAANAFQILRMCRATLAVGDRMGDVAEFCWMVAAAGEAARYVSAAHKPLQCDGWSALLFGPVSRRFQGHNLRAGPNQLCK
jgi:hypothetical protein